MTTHSLIPAALVALVSLAPACSLDLGEPDEPDATTSSVESASRYPGETTGRLATNRLTSNRLTSNRLTSNRLTSNRLTSNRLTSNGLVNTDFQYELNDAGTRELFSYVIGCALEADQQVTFKASSGANYTFSGDLGFAPEWRDGSCGTACKQKVSGCVLARVNWTGRGKALSLRVLGDQISTTEAADHPIDEGAYYGDLFDQGTGPLPLNYCHYAPIGRHCDRATDPDCAIAFRGGCDCSQVSGGTSTTPGSTGRCAPYNPTHDKPQQACLGGVQANGTFGACSDGDWLETTGGDPLRTRTWGYAIAVHGYVLSNDHPDACAHADYETGTRLTPAACSICARKVARLGGVSHRTGANLSPMPSCTTSSWTSTCVARARDLCGDHSVCEPGPKLYAGDSRCVDDVCAADAYCCNNAWDAQCVSEATSICGLDCSAY